MINPYFLAVRWRGLALTSCCHLTSRGLYWCLYGSPQEVTSLPSSFHLAGTLLSEKLPLLWAFAAFKGAMLLLQSQANLISLLQAAMMLSRDALSALKKWWHFPWRKIITFQSWGIRFRLMQNAVFVNDPAFTNEALRNKLSLQPKVNKKLPKCWTKSEKKR